MKYIVAIILGITLNLGISQVQPDIVIESDDVSSCDPDTCLFSVDEVHVLPKFHKGNLTSYLLKQLDNESKSKIVSTGGKVYLEVVIERNGDVSKSTILKTFDTSLNDKIIEVVNETGIWDPASIQGRPVRCKMIIPLIF